MSEVNNNYTLLENLKKKYQEEFDIHQKLSKLINDKIQILKNKESRDIESFELEKQALISKFEMDKINIETKEFKITEMLNEIGLLEYDIENNKPEVINLDACKKEMNIKIADINSIISKKQNIKKDYDLQKNKLNQSQQNEILKIKIDLKANQLSGTEREEYLKNELSKVQEDYQNFVKRWDDSLEVLNNKKEDIQETINVLNDILSEQVIDKQFERRKLSDFSKQWFSEKKKNAKYTKILEEQIKEHENEKDILISNQIDWFSDVKKENTIIISELQEIIIEQEAELKVLDSEILKTETSISDVDKQLQTLNININKKSITELNQIKWGLKIALGDLVQKRLILNDKYQYSLIDLSNANKKLNTLINNDPFKQEIKKLKNSIDKKNILINQIKKRENIIVQNDKKYLIENRNKYQQIKLEIVQLNDQISKLDIDFTNTNERFLEEKEYINKKINSKNEELNDHYTYMNKFVVKSDSDISNITETYKARFDNINTLITQNMTEIDDMKSQIATLTKNYDLLVKKQNESIDNYKRKNIDLTKKKTLVSNEQSILKEMNVKFEYQQSKLTESIANYESQITDIKLNNLETIQKLNKNLNESELELNIMKNKIDELEKIVIDEYMKLTSDIISSIEYENKKEIQQKIQQEIQEMDELTNDLSKFENFIENGLDLSDEIATEINSFNINQINENIAKYHEPVETLDMDIDIDIDITDFMENNNSNDLNYLNDIDKTDSIEFEQNKIKSENEIFFKEVSESIELEQEDNTTTPEKVDIVNSVQLYEISISEQESDINKMKEPIDAVFNLDHVKFNLEENNTTIEIIIPENHEFLEQTIKKEKEQETKNIEEIVNTVNLEQEDTNTINLGNKVDIVDSVQLFEISISISEQDNIPTHIDEIIIVNTENLEQEDNTPLENTVDTVHETEQEIVNKVIEEIVNTVQLEQEDNIEEKIEKDVINKNIEEIVNTVQLEQEDTTTTPITIESVIDIKIIEEPEQDTELENKNIEEIIDNVNLQLKESENMS